MRRIIVLLSVLLGLVLISCGTGYNVASATYDDATYFRPGVTAHVHVLPDVQTAEQLKAETVALAKQEGTRLETVYTDPEGVVDIDVTPGTTYLIMSPQDDSYARKLEMLEEEEDEDYFQLTINMNFGYDYYSDYPYYYWNNYTWRSPWNRPWFSSLYRPWYWYDYWYMPMYGNAYFGYNPWYWTSWSYDPWYYDPWYRPWFGYGFYSGWYGNGWYDPFYSHDFRTYTAYRHNVWRNDPGSNLNRINKPGVRSGGSYKRIDPNINQLSGSRKSRETDISKETRTTDPQIRSYQRVSGNTESKAVYREDATQTSSFYRRSSNLSENKNNVRNQGTTTSESTRSTVTTNPGSSRSFYRSNATPSGTVNSSRSGVTRSSSSSSSRSSSSSGTFNRSDSYSSGSSSRSSSSGSAGTRSGGSYSGGSGGGSSRSGGGSSSSSGSGYHR